jgi:3-methyl-2-oxobutanoate hydroxymethyltransferase
MKLLDFKIKKEKKEKISMVTCYDYPSALMVAETNINCVLIGDSVAMAVHGHDSTLMADMEMMCLHTAAVSRGISQQFIVSDLPFLCHRESLAHTVRQVRRLIQSGAHAIKIESAPTDPNTCKTIAHLVTAGVPIMGHIGLTPQSVLQLGGYRIQGRAENDAEQLLKQALQLEAAGCFALVIECVPSALARTITQALSIPTIGIGAGVETDGQVLVWHDLLGLQTTFKPRFVKQFANGKDLLLSALQTYAADVHHAQFPTIDHAF